ncbi:hypothetical protein [Shewanella mangrovisoli]|uniref:hypothetical protein n=1 Tax=Shewanella mangrovisoli TaxID=2864211 RepID=UPI0035B8F3A7
MVFKNSVERIQMQARSESMTKWISRIESETDIITEGESPTQRMEDLIEKIKKAIESNDKTDNSELDDDINQLIVSAYSQGVQDGFAKSLSKFIKGSITTKKVRNEETWRLSTYSTSYQITASLPTIDDGQQKVTVKIKLSEHGFKY